MKPGANGSRMLRRLVRPDADRDPMVEPCQDWYREMILYLVGFPDSRWYWRAMVMAASVASDPPLRNFTASRSPGATATSRLASSRARGLLPCMVGEKCKTSICLRMASMTRRLECPTETT